MQKRTRTTGKFPTFLSGIRLRLFEPPIIPVEQRTGIHDSLHLFLSRWAGTHGSHTESAVSEHES